jgi:phage gp36-like protein
MRQNPNLKPHNPKQAYLERAIAEYVVASGFLEGRHVRPLKEKPKISLVEKRSNYAKDMLKKHQDNLKRTAKLVTKWQKKVRYYEKRNAPS